MQFRRFNDAGIEEFRAYLHRLREQPTLAPPVLLLTDDRFSEALEPALEATAPEAFENRLSFASWLHEAAETADVSIPRGDAGFWAWLSLALFDHVCPPDGNGRRKPKEDARYLPMLKGARRYYRHALLGPYLVFRRFRHNPDLAAPLLCGSLSKLTDEAYRLFVENQLVSYPGAVAVLNEFYFDPSRGKIKRGAQTKKPGSIRRLVKVLSQYARTYDLDVVSESQLKEMLPREFSLWRDPRLFA